MEERVDWDRLLREPLELEEKVVMTEMREIIRMAVPRLPEDSTLRVQLERVVAKMDEDLPAGAEELDRMARRHFMAKGEGRQRRRH